jgi:hypothetical protein
VTKGAKIAVGCGIAAVLIVVIAVAAAIGVGLWGARKLKSAGFDPAKMAKFGELQQKADAIPFTAPADGVIPEERFLRFLAIRKAVFPVYEQHRAALEKLRDKRHETDAGDVMAMTGMGSAILYARVSAMDAQQMGSAEYTWMAEAAYKAHLGTRVAAATGGKSASQAVAEAMEKARKDVEAQRRDSGAGTAERDQALDEAQRQLEAAGQAARAQAATVDVPAANLALFEKYKDDIERYAMPELALIGM